jgi:uncharacterized protein (DUF427 family)
VGDRTEEDIAWSYETPYDEGEAYAGYIAFYWDRADQWLEDDEDIVDQPYNPGEES